MSEHCLVVGAGLSGAVLARALAETGVRVTVLEGREHIGGNCHTERDPETGVLVHRYGPHIFHTADQAVWDYVQRFARWHPYAHRVRTIAQGQVYALPLNLHTINQFFGTIHGPDAARILLAQQSDQSIRTPQNFEEQALHLMGRSLYDAFFAGYTRKQWGRDPRELPASILQRLPMRFSYDDRYFDHPYQAMPDGGYTAMIARILDHPAIELSLGRPAMRADAAGFDHVFCTGPLDAWFGHALGRLGYRTLEFERFTHNGDYQGCAVMNYADPDTPYTRITEHKHFAPWERHDASVLFREYPRACGPDDTPYYPIRLAQEKNLLAQYVACAQAEDHVTFLGRLGTYRYLDMDVCIREALDCARAHVQARKAGMRPPVFSVPPL